MQILKFPKGEKNIIKEMWVDCKKDHSFMRDYSTVYSKKYFICN